MKTEENYKMDNGYIEIYQGEKGVNAVYYPRNHKSVYMSLGNISIPHGHFIQIRREEIENLKDFLNKVIGGDYEG